jgi:hypothetical protein
VNMALLVYNALDLLLVIRELDDVFLVLEYERNVDIPSDFWAILDMTEFEAEGVFLFGDEEELPFVVT